MASTKKYNKRYNNNIKNDTASSLGDDDGDLNIPDYIILLDETTATKRNASSSSESTANESSTTATTDDDDGTASSSSVYNSRIRRSPRRRQRRGLNSTSTSSSIGRVVGTTTNSLSDKNNNKNNVSEEVVECHEDLMRKLMNTALLDGLDDDEFLVKKEERKISSSAVFEKESDYTIALGCKSMSTSFDHDDDYTQNNYSSSIISRVTSCEDDYDDESREKQQAENKNPATISRNPRTKHRVYFSTVTTRYYNRILTENPSTVQGPSIGIGWNYDENTISLLEYEYERRHNNNNRSSHLVILNREQREQLLLELGYSRKELATTIRKNNRTKNQRRQTIHNLGTAAQRMEEVLDTVRRKLQRLRLKNKLTQRIK